MQLKSMAALKESPPKKLSGIFLWREPTGFYRKAENSVCCCHSKTSLFGINKKPNHSLLKTPPAAPQFKDTGIKGGVSGTVKNVIGPLNSARCALLNEPRTSSVAQKLTNSHHFTYRAPHTTINSWRTMAASARRSAQRRRAAASNFLLDPWVASPKMD